MKILRLFAALSLLAGSVFAQSLDRRALDTNAFYTTIVNAQNPNGGGVDSKYWTNQSGLYRYQPGTGPVVNASPGPPFVIRGDGSTFVGTNVFQDVAPTAVGMYSPYVVSMTASNEPTTVHADWWAIDSEAYGVYGGANLTVQQGGSSTLTLSGDTGTPISIVTLNATPGSDYIKINDNGTDRFKASGSATNVVHENAVGQDWLSIGQTNGIPTVKIRADGSVFYGKSTIATGDETDYGAVFFETVTTVNSNEPPIQLINWQIKGWESDGGFFDSYLSSRIVADKDAPSATLDLESEGTNSSTRIRLVSAPGGSQLEYKANGSPRFAFDNLGDLIWLKSVAYSWPTNYGGANSILSDTTGAGVLKWTNIAAIVTNNQARIGPGTATFIAQFLNPTNVTDTRVAQVATNQWDWNIRTNLAAITNSFTNKMYGRYTSATDNQGLMIVVQPPGLALPNELTAFQGSANATAMNTLQLQNSWVINGYNTNVTPNAFGHLLPVADFDTSTQDGLDIGISTKRVRDISIGRVIAATPRNDSIIFGDGYTGHGYGVGTAGTLYFTGPGLAGIQFNSADLGGGAQLDMKLYPIGFGGSISNPVAWLRYGGLAGLVAVGTNSSVAAPSTVGVMGAPASGTDKGGPDLRIVGGPSTGTGTNGNVRIQTAEKAASTSSSVNTSFKDRMFVIADPIILTTNSATIVFNATIPTALRGFGGTVFAHTEIENGVDIATTDETFNISANRKGTTVVAGTPSAPITATSTSGGSAAIANTWTLVANAQSVDLKLTCVTSGIVSTNSTVRVTFIPNSSAVPVITHP